MGRIGDGEKGMRSKEEGSILMDNEIVYFYAT